MEAINTRLKQLEDTEARLYLERQATIQRRSLEDANVEMKRKEEDKDYLVLSRKRDQEEDELRQNRRILSRSALGQSVPNQSQVLSPGAENATTGSGPTTRSKSKPKSNAKRSSGGVSKKITSGSPTAHDSQGRALFTRPSDGKLVYLQCYMAGCVRASFETVSALRRHVSDPRYYHKMKGIFTDNNHAIEVCGQVAPGQEGFEVEASDQSLGMAPIANMTRTGAFTSSVSNPGGNGHEHGNSLGSTSNTLVDSDENRSIPSVLASVRDLGRTYRASSTHRRGESGLEARTRTQLANETFLTSDTEDENEEEAQPITPVPANNIDRYVAGRRKSTRCNETLVGVENFEKCAKAENECLEGPAQEHTDPIVKEERAVIPSLFLNQLDDCPSPVSLITPSEAVSGPISGAKNVDETHEGTVVNMRNLKRAASTSSSTPPPSPGKRPHKAEEP